MSYFSSIYQAPRTEELTSDPEVTLSGGTCFLGPKPPWALLLWGAPYQDPQGSRHELGRICMQAIDRPRVAETPKGRVSWWQRCSNTTKCWLLSYCWRHVEVGVCLKEAVEFPEGWLSRVDYTHWRLPERLSLRSRNKDGCHLWPLPLQVQRSFDTIYRLRARQGWLFPLLSLLFATPAGSLCSFLDWRVWRVLETVRSWSYRESLRNRNSTGAHSDGYAWGHLETKRPFYFFLWSWTRKREGFVSYRKTVKIKKKKKNNNKAS